MLIDDFFEWALNPDTRGHRHSDSPLSQRSAIANGRYCHVMYLINFCILALGSGQHLLYRLGLGLVLVLVCAYCSACADLCESGLLRSLPFAIADLNRGHRFKLYKKGSCTRIGSHFTTTELLMCLPAQIDFSPLNSFTCTVIKVDLSEFLTCFN